LKNFYVTFGQKYRYKRHPQGGHPDGWFCIKAESWEKAREETFKSFGDRWSFLYSEEEFNRGPYVLGCLGVTTAF